MPGRSRIVRLAGWVAAANAVALAFALMPGRETAAEGARTILGLCGIG